MSRFLPAVLAGVAALLCTSAALAETTVIHAN